MAQITIEKSALTVKDVDARLTAMSLQLGVEDTLTISRNLSTAELFKNMVPQLKPGTLDVLVATHKDKTFGEQILKALDDVLTHQHIIDIAKTRNYRMLMDVNGYGYDNKEKLKRYHTRLSNIPNLKEIFKHTVFSNQESSTTDIDTLIEDCVPDEFEPYKDYEQFRQRITAYCDTPVYLLEYYKNYTQDDIVFRNIFLKDTFSMDVTAAHNKPVKWSWRYRESLFSVQKHIAQTHINHILRYGSRDENGYPEETVSQALLKFMERNAKKFKVVVEEVVEVEKGGEVHEGNVT